LNGKVATPGLENRDYGRGDPLRRPRDNLYQLKLALTSSAGCGRSVGIVRLRTKTTEFFLYEYTNADGKSFIRVLIISNMFEEEIMYLTTMTSMIYSVNRNFDIYFLPDIRFTLFGERH
jgi:hypothetical protein